MAFPVPQCFLLDGKHLEINGLPPPSTPLTSFSLSAKSSTLSSVSALRRNAFVMVTFCVTSHDSFVQVMASKFGLAETSCRRQIAGF